jgi:hypothetical protein
LNLITSFFRSPTHPLQSDPLAPSSFLPAHPFSYAPLISYYCVGFVRRLCCKRLCNKWCSLDGIFFRLFCPTNPALY